MILHACKANWSEARHIVSKDSFPREAEARFNSLMRLHDATRAGYPEISQLARKAQAEMFARTIDPATDGSRIAVTDSPTFAGQVRILNLTNSTDHVISLIPRQPVLDVNWAADGNSLFAVGNQHPDFVILQIDLNGKTQVVLNKGKDYFLVLPPMAAIWPSANRPGRAMPGCWRTSDPHLGSPR
jgi:hypothetical protein